MHPEINPLEQFIKEAYPLSDVWAELAKEIGYVRAAWAQKQLNDAIEEHQDIDFPDNTRWCRVGFPKEEAEFYKLSGSGCCGSHEWEATDPDGQVWWFGFNYGH